MLSNYLKIRQARNGWILEHVTEGETEDIYAFSEELTPFFGEEGEARAFCSLLQTVQELCGAGGSRYSSHRVHVCVKPGDKFEG